MGVESPETTSVVSVPALWSANRADFPELTSFNLRPPTTAMRESAIVHRKLSYCPRVMRHRSAVSSPSCRRARRSSWGPSRTPGARTAGDPRSAPSPTRIERRLSVLCVRRWRRPACMRRTWLPHSIRELLPDTGNHRRPDRGIPIYQIAGVNRWSLNHGSGSLRYYSCSSSLPIGQVHCLPTAVPIPPGYRLSRLDILPSPNT